MTKRKTGNWLNNLSAEERYRRAREKLSSTETQQGLVNDALKQMRWHENTKWLIERTEVQGQVEPSYAAHAFEALQRSLVEHEIINLCSFWDNAAKNSHSIPTIVALAEGPEIERLVFQDHKSKYPGESVGQIEGEKAVRVLDQTIKAAKRKSESDALKSLKNLRHKMAHSLIESDAEQKGKLFKEPAYSMVGPTFRQTQIIVRNLYCCLSGTSFNFQDSRKIASRNAAYFWSGVTINVKG
ncbi:MAG: hypothetical protein AAFQ36_01985 [Pseudomonadota bacterium]